MVRLADKSPPGGQAALLAAENLLRIRIRQMRRSDCHWPGYGMVRSESGATEHCASNTRNTRTRTAAAEDDEDMKLINCTHRDCRLGGGNNDHNCLGRQSEWARIHCMYALEMSRLRLCNVRQRSSEIRDEHWHWHGHGWASSKAKHKQAQASASSSLDTRAGKSPSRPFNHLNLTSHHQAAISQDTARIGNRSRTGR